MDDTPSKPNFFERMISRLSGEPDSAEDVVSLLRQAHGQEVFDADTLRVWKRFWILSIWKCATP